MNVTAVGMMSGTSLDGIDLALCRFTRIAGEWKYEIIDAKTIDYPLEWTKKLKNASNLKAIDFLLLHNEYGRFIGELINEFLEGKILPDLICSHGHTIFHQPENRFTFQLGNGAFIASGTGITTVSDFRNLDVALGGQGAPLVPIGDKLLFGEYDYCINLGGFANISFEQNNQRIAFDICPVNIILNYLAGQRGLPFDYNGELGNSGNVNNALLKSLNALEYYQQLSPKSLGREWIEQKVIPLLQGSDLTIGDQAATFYEHISLQISKILGSKGKILFTGGGTKNTFLLKRIRSKVTCQIVIPEEKLINFKEALIFAFLGVLASDNKINCLSSVTGAKADSVTGTVFPMQKQPS